MPKNGTKSRPTTASPVKYSIVHPAAVKSLLAGRSTTSAAMARALGISGPLMSHLINGRRNPVPYLGKMARFLRVPIHYLLAAARPKRPLRAGHPRARKPPLALAPGDANAA